MATVIGNDRIDLAHVGDHAASVHESKQYALWKVISLWLAGGAPMWILTWLVFPALRHNLDAADAGLLLLKLLSIGLAWQFVLSLFILYREEGNLRLATIRRRFWLNHPISPKSGRVNKRLWLLIVPFILLVVTLQLGVSSTVNGVWTKVFPFFSEPQGYGIGSMFAPELRSQWVGAWELLLLIGVNAVLNTFVGEEFLFRGVLLPKMNGIFGRWDWVANGILFGLYHLHKPWGIPTSIFTGLIYAFTGKQFRSNWFPIILHSGQSLYFIVMVLGLVLGLA